MSESSTMPGAAVRLHVADEDDQATSVELDAVDEADAIDEPDAEKEEDYSIDSILDLEAEEEEPFETIADLIDLGKAEREGRWVKYPLVQDGEVYLCHLKTAVDTKAKLERELREKKGLTYTKFPDGKLPGKTEEKLWRHAMFGTAVRGWRGKSFEALKFTQKNFLLLLEEHRFYSFVMRYTGKADDLRKKMKEDAEGN